MRDDTNQLLSQLDSAMSTIKSRVGAVTSAAQPLVKRNEHIQADLLELQEEWDRLNASYLLLKEEQKEDGWLSRFRT